MPNPSPISLGGGRRLAGGGWKGASDRSWLTDEVSPSMVPQSTRLAAKACWAVCARIGGHRERKATPTALRTMSGLFRLLRGRPGVMTSASRMARARDKSVRTKKGVHLKK